MVHVKDLDLFVTVQRLEDTPPVLPLGQLCEDPSFFPRTGPEVKKNTSNQTWQEDTMQHGEIRDHGRSRSCRVELPVPAGTTCPWPFPFNRVGLPVSSVASPPTASLHHRTCRENFLRRDQ